MTNQKIANLVRVVAFCVIAAGAGLWAGSHWWSHSIPTTVAAAQSNVTPGSLEAGFAPVVQKDLPAVVNISSSKVVHNQGNGGGNDGTQLFNDPFFRQFFGNNFGGAFRAPRDQVEHSLGSGVIVNADGYILTNNHVVDGATDITVTLSDKRDLKAKVVGTDPKSDLAVLKVDAKNLPTLTFGDSSKVRAGDLVLAIGSPFGLRQTVTMGIISATGRSGLGIEDYEDFIQTDAAINPGNSGGALVNTRGDLIGINTAILNNGSNGNEGVGFAVPSNMAHAVIAQILEHGKVSRGYMGVAPEDITSALAQSFHLSDTRGVLIADVSANSPAAQAGIERGDVIREMNGQKIDDANQLRLRVSMTAPGTAVQFKLLHDGAEKTVSVKLAELPEQAQREGPNVGGGGGSRGRGPSALNGVMVQNVDSETLRELNLPPTTKGVVVTDVADGSPAAMAGLQSGDIIEEVNRGRVTNVDEFERALRNASSRTVLLLVNHGGNVTYIAIEPR
jgi:serine protease Do